ncbi:MAG: hypothetical protein LBR10_10540 [Prevotellaceae bacterium]|jgi:hypothetical protein|nr:hypothetical protein [Prevotellaceae bacterium]
MKLNVFVEKPLTDGKPATNLSAYIAEVQGFITVAPNVRTLQRKIKDALEFHADGMAEDGFQDPWIIDRNWEFIYHYDLGALLDLYQGVFNRTNLARVTGLHESIIKQYIAGTKTPSKKQLLRIQNNLHSFAAGLSEIHIL